MAKHTFRQPRNNIDNNSTKPPQTVAVLFMLYGQQAVENIQKTHAPGEIFCRWPKSVSYLPWHNDQCYWFCIGCMPVLMPKFLQPIHADFGIFGYKMYRPLNAYTGRYVVCSFIIRLVWQISALTSLSTTVPPTKCSKSVARAHTANVHVSVVLPLIWVFLLWSGPAFVFSISIRVGPAYCRN